MPRRTVGSGSSPGRCWSACMFLIVEIFANRPLANSIGHAQDSLRRAQGAAEHRLRPHRFVSGGGCGLPRGGRPRSHVPPGRRGLDRPRRRERLGIRPRVGSRRPDPAGRVLLRPPAGRARTLATAPGRSAPARPRCSRTNLAGSIRTSRDRGARSDGRSSAATPRSRSPAMSCIVQPGLPEATTAAPVDATASAFSRLSRPDISGSVTL